MSRLWDDASRTPLATTLARIFIAAVVFNYPWERAQSTLYVARDGTPIPWWQCFSMSLGDGLISQDGFSILGCEGMRSWPLPGLS